ncbi:hypothetical protein Gotri_019572, partial [Gossypium trilobum]|nr:hypothetical protein [Gossypium trilobum]
KKRVNVFVLSIYGLVIFPKALGRIDEAVLDLFNRLDKRVMPITVEKVSYRVFSDNYPTLKEFMTTQGEKTFLKKIGWIKHQNNGDKKSKKKILGLISGKRNSKMLEFEEML